MPLFPENDFTISSASSSFSADRYRPLFPDTRNTQGPHEPLSEPVSPMLDPNGRGDPVGPARHSASVARDASTSRSPSNTQHTHVTQGASALDGCRMWSEDVFSHGPNAIFPSTTCKEHEHVPRSDVPEGPCCPPPRRVSRASSALKRSLAEIDTSTNASRERLAMRVSQMRERMILMPALRQSIMPFYPTSTNPKHRRMTRGLQSLSAT